MKTKITVQDTMAAYRALKALTVSVPVKYCDARMFCDILDEFEKRCSIIESNLQKIIAKFGGNATGNGLIEFPDSGAKTEFEIEYNEFMMQEDSIEYQEVNLSEYADYITLPIDAVKNLNRFIVF